ncbi:MAG: peptidylprolyl isomerase [Kordia sp.]|nr:MAG: peptidylprolyl isomerase [Kordia sp.]
MCIGEKSLLMILLFVVCSCSFFDEKEQEKSIARVNDMYLYESDFIKHLPENLSIKDSTLFANQYINNWATKQLLKQHATLNLDESKLETFEQLAQDYKLELYTNAYLDALITKQLNTEISNSEFDTLYKYSKQNFKLNEELLKYRYICLEKDYKDLKSIKEKFKRFDNEDKVVLDSLSIQFNSFMLNDSLWVKKSLVIKTLPIINTPKNIELLKKSNFLQFEDSIRVYLVRVNDLLKRNEQAPQEYVERTLEQIILNKRKLKLIKQLEIDVRKDAIQNKEFEIYN